MNKKSKIITTVLLVMTVGLMLSIVYIGYMLTATPEKSPQIAPRKTKAQSAGYSKIISLDTQSGLDETQPTPTSMLTVSPTVSLTPAVSVSPSPTEIILAYQNPTVTSGSTPSATVTASASATPTRTATLPKTGFINNAIILFGVSALVIFVSFIF
jgi:LPXTG-motif cell wall-anchored protein